MKKQLLAGAASLVMAVTPVLSVFATDVEPGGAPGGYGDSKDVTVGEVDETVYSVDITWGDMTFDWKYDAESNSFGFVGHKCAEIGIGSPLPESASGAWYYVDDTCTESVQVSEPGTYYAKRLTSTIDVDDNSTNGRIKAQASFASEEKYSWVIGKFSSVVYLNLDSTFSQDLEDGYLAGTMGSLTGTKHYNGVLYLEPKADAEYDPSSVVAEDKIGTVTLTITPDLN